MLRFKKNERKVKSFFARREKTFQHSNDYFLVKSVYMDVLIKKRSDLIISERSDEF